ncbi:MAG TPA: glycosyltransferase family 2 protein [Bryobacterales bacterium]|nr:glycosyltransferase family 2 protein [Bryobacterales bacterium]
MNLPVAAIVVTYNSELEIDNCLKSLENVAEIVVVDNGSADRTCEVAAGRRIRVQLIANSENRGFAGAANQGAEATSSPLLLFLNPDAAVVSGLEALVRQFGDPSVGAATGRLVDAAGRAQLGFNVRSFPTPASLACELLAVNRLWPGNPVNRRYRCLDMDYHRPQNVEQPAGAFLMVRREVLRRVGGWDERFFPLWFEDVDLCRRIAGAGYSIWYVPGCVAQHRGAHSLASVPAGQRRLYWYGSLLSYSNKHFSPSARAAIRLSVLLGASLRMAASLVRGREWQSYETVMRMALRRRKQETRQVQPHVLT